MAKYFRLLIVILFLTSCEKEEIIPIQDVTGVVETTKLTSKEESKIDIELDGRLPIDTELKKLALEISSTILSSIIY